MGSNHVQLSDEETGYASYITDLSPVILSEGDLPEWVQALPVGEFKSPIYGKMVFDEVTLSDFYNNWKSGARGQDLDIDLEHKRFTSEAAGWVTDVKVELSDPEPKNNGLWFKIDWTGLGVEKLQSKRYRYFSTDYFNQWTDPTGKTHKNILNGGALTNRPVLKGMRPIVLSEEDERLQMNREALERLAKSLGVSFSNDTTDAELQSLVEAAAIASDDSDTGNAADEATQDENTGDLVGAGTVQLSEADMNNPAIQRLLSELSAGNERIAKLEQANKLSEINRQLSDLGSGSYVVIPKVLDQVRAVMLSSDEATGKSVLEIVQAMADKNAVRQLGEIGGSNGNGADNTANTLSDFEAAARKLSEGDKITYLEAIDRIAEEQPALYQSYMKAQYTNGGVN